MSKHVVVIDRDVAEVISDMLHKAEAAEVMFTETEDEMWGYLTEAIQQAAEIKP